jgi:hypothetical protein
MFDKSYWGGMCENPNNPENLACPPGGFILSKE